MKAKTLSYIWEVVKNLIALFVILGILSVAYTSFEKVVVCGLVLIYLSIISISSVLGIEQLNFMQALDFEFKRIRKLLKEDLSEYEKEAEERANNTKNKITIKFYINGIFNFIFYLIVIFTLFEAL